MNTITKLLFFIILFLFSSSLNAAWYGAHKYHTSGMAGWCDEDGQPDTIFPLDVYHGAYYGSDGYEHHYGQRRITGWWNGYNDGWMRCEYWDATSPVAASLSYSNSSTNGWQNTTVISLKVVASDYGGSSLGKFMVKVYRAGAQASPVNLYEQFTTTNGNLIFPYTGQNGFAYKFEVCPIDGAGNQGNCVGSPDIARIDTTPPNMLNLSDGSPLHLLATNDQIFSLNYADSVGSPVQIWYRFEKNNDPSSTDALDTAGYNYVYSYHRDISKVDNDRAGNGGRPINIYIHKVCDQAGNCVNGSPIKIISHSVYANPNTALQVNSISQTMGSNIADGQPNAYTRELKDGYGNQIIPAIGINRTISMNLSNISNSMFLDQHARTGPTSVFVNNKNTTLQLTGPQSIGQRNSSDGKYPLDVFVYTPTKDGYANSADTPISDPNATFGFNIDLVVNDNLIGQSVNKTFSQSIGTPAYRPLFVSKITGNLRDGGFIEGVNQISPVTITKNSGVNPDAPVFQLEFGGTNAGNFTFKLIPTGGDIGGIPTPIQYNFNSIPQLMTRVLQKPSVVANNLSNLYLSTHFAYNLDNKSILYNSDIIGKVSYFGTASNIGTQVGIKIIGPISSNITSAIVRGQFAQGTSMFSGISRTEIRNNIKKAIALAIRNITLTQMGTTITNIAGLPSGGTVQGGKVDIDGTSSVVLLRGNSSQRTIRLGNAGGIQRIEGRRTLVIQGANLYIKNNMYYATKDSILGVVVQKDSEGNGGNLYIDPAITNIVGSYIIDGSVMSSEDGQTAIGIGKIDILKNQLYVYGSITSENTIGGSRMNPSKCPPLLNVSCSTVADAQKYDLNYLRRYYLYGGIPFGNGKIIGGGTCISANTCGGGDANLTKKFTSTTEDLAQYPVIIEYNPVIRNNPPIGFDQMLE